MSGTITIDRSKLYGVLHEPSGRPIVRQVRVLKVGIGARRGLTYMCGLTKTTNGVLRPERT
jgi:hypothetical protein